MLLSISAIIIELTASNSSSKTGKMPNGKSRYSNNLINLYRFLNFLRFDLGSNLRHLVSQASNVMSRNGRRLRSNCSVLRQMYYSSISRCGNKKNPKSQKHGHLHCGSAEALSVFLFIFECYSFIFEYSF